MTRRIFVRIWTLVLALLVPFAAADAHAAARLQSRLSADKAARTTADEVVVRFTLTNGGDAAARMLRWHTPLFGANDNLFEVTRDGQPVAYVGRHVRRLPPTAADYVVVRPGEVLSTTVPLSSLYDFSKPGQYNVRYRVRVFAAPAGATKRALVDLAASNALTLELGGEDLSAAVEEATDAAAGAARDVGAAFLAPRYRNCSTARRNTITGALSGAQTHTNRARTQINMSRGGSRYTLWFGAYTANRLATARRIYGSIDDALRNKTLEFDCGCTEPSWYAYVFSNAPYTIYLCPVFWNASADDKAGTITHELSHFNVVGATADWEYGVSASQQLARDWPDYTAGNDSIGTHGNADTIAYFGYP